jgi:hypothetical protein
MPNMIPGGGITISTLNPYTSNTSTSTSKKSKKSTSKNSKSLRMDSNAAIMKYYKNKKRKSRKKKPSQEIPIHKPITQRIYKMGKKTCTTCFSKKPKDSPIHTYDLIQRMQR